MTEATPNSKGPAQFQMSPEQAASLGLTPTPEGTAPTEPTLVPADQVKPEDVGTLTIEYRDGRPVIVVSGGQFVPAALAVVHQSGEADNARRAGMVYIPLQSTLFPGPTPVPPSLEDQFVAIGDDSAFQ
ncbi:hypothetical protein [Embleya sp. NPDC059237]|uniref:hypothetical protein n=1 Tax=Embleya sp. NPDC059237 TaxID=3346784 RepID=UPI003680086E